MGIKFTNNGHSTLASSINTSATSITVASGHGARFPSLSTGDYFYATLIDASNNLEIVKVTARSSDVLTVTRAQDNTSARAYGAGDRIELRVTAAVLGEVTDIYNSVTAETGYFALPSGTTAQRPGSAQSGWSRFNSTTGSLEFFDGTSWIATNLIPTISAISGNLYPGLTTTITLTVTNGTDTLDVKILEGSTLHATVEDVTNSSGTVSVVIPSAAFNNFSGGDTITFSVLNSDGTPSSNTQNLTVTALPSGGTISTYTLSGQLYRVHTFNSSGTFTNTATRNARILMIAGGGSTAGAQGAAGGTGGGGAGGLVYYKDQSITQKNYTVSIGAGGTSTSSDDSGARTGNNTTMTDMTTAVGGGKSFQGTDGDGASRNGGSGGGAGFGSNQPYTGIGSGTTNQGNNGGAGSSSNSGTGGGGGGAGEAGSTDGTGQGGDGVQEGSSSVYNFNGGGNTTFQVNGTSDYYAGGGGAGSIGADGIAGGQGGGGNGDISTNSNHGTANTGGGGGGCATQAGTGGNGGSGKVCISYAI